MYLKSFSGIILLFLGICGFGYAQVLKHTTKINLTDGVLTTQNEFLIQINEYDQRALGSFDIACSKNERLKIEFAEIIDKDGKTVRKIKQKELSTRSAFENGIFYNDNYITEIKLVWHQYPYNVRVSYTKEVKNYLHFAYWKPKIYKNKTPLTSVVELDIPKSEKVNFYFDKNFELSKNSYEDRISYRWEMIQQDIPEREIYGPNFKELVPTLLIIPEEFYYGFNGNQSTWENFGNWFFKLNNNKLQLTAAEKEKVDNLLENKSSEIEVIKTLYNYLQDNTSYVNVSIDLGGYESFPAEYVCKNKYGDCKALTTYMKALLDYKGIKTNYVLVNAGRTNDIIERLPSAQFNHIILAANIGKDTIWLENTSKTNPFAQNSTFTQNRKALWLEHDSSKIIQIPRLNDSEVLCESNFVITLKENNTAAFKIHKILRGNTFENYVYQKSNLENNELKDYIKEGLPFRKCNIDEFSINQEYRNQNYIEAFILGSVENFTRNISDILLINYPKIKIPAFEKVANRETPLIFKAPIHKKHSILIHHNNLKDFSLKEKPPVILKSAYGIYSLDIKNDNASVILEESFLIYAKEYDLEEYPDFYNFLSQIKTVQKEHKLTLTKHRN